MSGIKDLVDKAYYKLKETVAFDPIYWFKYKGQVHEFQVKMYEALQKASASVSINIMAGRRSGKTYFLSVILAYYLKVKEYEMVVVVPSHGTFESSYLNEMRTILKREYGYKDNQIHYSRNSSRLIIDGCGGIVRVAVVKDLVSADKVRGMGTSLRLAIIDEAGIYNQDLLRYLINSCITYIRIDHDAPLILAGTPPRQGHGVLPERMQKGDTENQFCFHFNMYNNPYLTVHGDKRIKATIKSYCEANGITEDDPEVQREMYARIIIDDSSKVFKFNSGCLIEDIPPLNTDWQYVGGLDLGSDDHATLSVLAFNTKKKEIYLVHNEGFGGGSLDDVEDMINRTQSKFGKYRIFADTAGGGKMLVKTLNQHGLYNILPIPNKKQKLVVLKALNTSMIHSRLKIPKKYKKLVKELQSVTWLEGTDRTLWKHVDPFTPNDYTDSLMYAFSGIHKISRVTVEPYRKKILSKAEREDLEFIDNLEKQSQEIAEQNAREAFLHELGGEDGELE